VTGPSFRFDSRGRSAALEPMRAAVEHIEASLGEDVSRDGGLTPKARRFTIT
jgi:hypothetical protein